MGPETEEFLDSLSCGKMGKERSSVNEGERFTFVSLYGIHFSPAFLRAASWCSNIAGSFIGALCL
jgi:hypothetical protein